MVIPEWRKEWDRHYGLRYFRAAGDTEGFFLPNELHGMGLPDDRFFLPPFRYAPLHYRPIREFSITNPPEHEEIILKDVLTAGLDFYVYLHVDSLYVTYDSIKEHDSFYLYIPSECIAQNQNVFVKCNVVCPPNENYKLHQIDDRWGFGTQAIVLPIWLRVETNELQKIQAVFDDPNNEMTTLSVSIVHRFKTQKLSEEVNIADNIRYSKIEGDVWVWNFRNNYFTFREKRDEPVRILVASDIHVSERNDTLAEKYSAQNPDFCNFNDQARELAKQAIEGWRKGLIDYVVLCGDIIDFALKDSFYTKINLYPSTDFGDDPKPYGIGHRFYNLSVLTDGSGHSIFTGENGQPDYTNLGNVRGILELLSDSTQMNFSNWQVFREIFSELIKCGVPMFLVPGNHDYLVFGYDLAGMDEETFDEFVDAIVSVDEPWLTILRAALNLVTMGCATLPYPPDYDPMAHFLHTGLTESEARDYDGDTNKRKLESNYRTFLGSFYDWSALHGIASIGVTTIPLGSQVSSYLIKQGSKNTRLGLISTGPAWNIIENMSPWLVGFPKTEKNEPNLALQQLSYWRDTLKDDMLILFTHAPTLSRFGTSHTKSTYWEEYNILLRGLIAGTTDTEEEAKTYTHMGIYCDPITDEPTYNLCGQQKTYYHGWIHALNLLAPLLQYSDPLYHKHPESALYPPPETIKARPNPVLVFSGHTHWRHTYSLLRLVHPIKPPNLDSARCVHYLCGNQLLNELNQISSRANAAAWWVGRALIVQTGCVGPIPQEDTECYNPQQLAAANQGYYVVKIEEGVVTAIDWNSLYYKT